MVHSHPPVTSILIRKTNGRSLGTFKRATLFWISGSVKQKNTFTLLLVFKDLTIKRIMVMSKKSEAM
jgi:hypothetical protein